MDPFLQLALILACILVAAKGAGYLSIRLGQPAVLGELLVGIVLGPTVLDVLHLPLFSGGHMEEVVGQLAHLGVLFLMFIAGLEVDLEMLSSSGRAATLAGVLGVLVPVSLGLALGFPFGHDVQRGLFIGLVLAATSVSISAQTLMELGVLRSRVGMALLGAAVVDDVLVIFILSIFSALVIAGNHSLGGILWIVVRMTGFLALAIWLGSKLIPSLVARVHRLPISEGVVTLAIVMTLFFSWSAEVLGNLAAITGAFLAGLLFARSSARQRVEEGIHTIAYAWLVPVFFVDIGLQTNARVLGVQGIPFALLIVGLAIVSKVVGCGLGARLGGFNNMDSLRLGVGMVSRGEVGLIVASVGLKSGLIGEEIFASAVIMVLTTTLITPVLLRALYARRAAPPQTASGA